MESSRLIDKNYSLYEFREFLPDPFSKISMNNPGCFKKNSRNHCRTFLKSSDALPIFLEVFDGGQGQVKNRAWSFTRLIKSNLPAHTHRSK